MFRKYYKAANDEIKPNRELIDKIFDEYDKKDAKNENSKVYRFGIRYGTAIAACLVLCFALAAYPQISKLNETPEMHENSDFDMYASQDDSFDYTISDEKAEEYIAEKQTDESETGKKSNAKQMPAASEEVSITSRTVNAPKPETKSYEIDISEMKSVSDDEISIAYRTLEEKFGKADKETGNLYSFEIAGRLDAEDSSYYLGRWKWLVDGHLSLICEFVMRDDLSGLYECNISDDMIRWTTDKNMLK